MTGFVICDLDGCLSDDRWRRHLLPDENDRTPEAYDRYHLRCAGDMIHEKCLASVRQVLFGSFGVSQYSELLIVTARPDRGHIRRSTTLWLRMFIPNIHYTLLMRPGDSQEHSRDLKPRLLREYFFSIGLAAELGWRQIVAAYDDRQDILDAYPIEEGRKRLFKIDD
jgi:hypothetical protein